MKRIEFDPKKTGRKIRDAILESGYSVEEVAAELKVSKQIVYQWMSTDSKKLPSLKHIVSLAGLLERSVDELIEKKDITGE